MAINRIDYAGQTLIDLTSDTITSDKLLFGLTAHDKTGSIITGTFLQDLPSTFSVEDNVQDSSGSEILDDALSTIFGQYIYAKR